MGRIAMIDGVLSPLERATVGVEDRGFLYGDSVFETLRTYDGHPFALDEHIERLARSAALVHIPLPIGKSSLVSEVLAAIGAAGNPESYVRVMVTRGSGELGLDPSLAANPLRVILVTPLDPPARGVYERGIRAVTFATRRHADGTEGAGAKIGNYLVSVLAMRTAREAGAGEALIVDRDGFVVEGATSNVFFVLGETLVTPPEGSGILPGITRSVLLRLAPRTGLRVEFRAPRTNEFGAFDEVFVSSSIRELLAVVAIDGAAVGGGTPGPVSWRLLDAFRAYTRNAV